MRWRDQSVEIYYNPYSLFRKCFPRKAANEIGIFARVESSRRGVEA